MSSTAASATLAAAGLPSSRTRLWRSNTCASWPACTRSISTALVVMGHSAGGQLALLAAARTTLPLRAAISLAGVVDTLAIHRTGDDNGVITRLLAGTHRRRCRSAGARPRRRRQSAARHSLCPRLRDRGRALGSERGDGRSSASSRRRRRVVDAAGRRPLRARRPARARVGRDPREGRSSAPPCRVA